MTNVERFMALFPANDRVRGQFVPKSGDSFAHKRPHDQSHFEEHVAGTSALGLAPILDDNRCWWGAIDIDCHHGETEPDLSALSLKIKSLGLPLVVCRSKSGGAHLYLFLNEPSTAQTVKKFLESWVLALGYPKETEVFPKQFQLRGEGEDKQFPSWINLPYFDIANTMRWAVAEGQRLSFEEFLDHAESMRTSVREINDKKRAIRLAGIVQEAGGPAPEMLELSLDGAPPCVAHMLTNGIDPGQRNDAMYSVAVFLKRFDPVFFRQHAEDVNEAMPKPLSNKELQKITASVARRNDPLYRCGVDPCKSLCQSATCVKREHGINENESGNMAKLAKVAFDRVVKIDSDPPSWKLYFGTHEVSFTGMQILDPKFARVAIYNKTGVIIPVMKADSWAEIIGPLSEEAEVVPMPEEATVDGMLRDKIGDFFRGTDLRESVFFGSMDKETKSKLVDNKPIAVDFNGKKLVAFRGGAMLDYFNQVHFKNEGHIWTQIKKFGFESRDIYHASRKVTIWLAPWHDGYLNDVLAASDLNLEPEI